MNQIKGMKPRVSCPRWKPCHKRTPNSSPTCKFVLDASQPCLGLPGFTHVSSLNRLTFTNVIHCIAHSKHEDAVERALSILDRMEELHSSGMGDVRPNLYTYNCVINTVAKSKRRGKAAMALELLRRVQSVALQPQTVTFNNVINACAFSDPDEEDPDAILETAVSILNEMDKPNCISYWTTSKYLL